MSRLWAHVYAAIFGSPGLLVWHGRPIARNLVRNGISRPELAALLRRGGVDDIAEVRRATLEPDGGLSVVRRRAPSSFWTSRTSAP